ncbi:MAG: aminopeptidase P family protein [Chloroflexi bacterium]|nr:aminopeptidase P family protein [Chloroflexota bacterium]
MTMTATQFTVGQPPTLSFAERDRRWERARGLMRERGLDCLVVAGFRSREMYESYLADDYNEGCVIFPLEGEPVVLTWAHLRVLRAYWSVERGNDLWIKDYRVAGNGTAAALVVQEKGLDAGKVGVVGLRSQAPTEMHGAIPAAWWQEFTEALPNVRFEDISEEFSHLMLVKSAEELAQIRYAAQAAESACRVVAGIADVGVGEEVIFAAAIGEMLRFGIGLRYPNVVMNSGPHTLSWGPPRWTTRGEAPRRLERGDLMQAELMPMCGNQEVQVQMTVALDPLDETNLRCEKAARESYDAGVRALRPGITFAELTDAMAEPFKEYGTWAYTPLVHSLSPHFLLGRPTINTENVDFGVRFMRGGIDQRSVRKATIQAGMVFAFEPNACFGKDHRVNLGGTIIVTEDGCEELNDIPTRVTHK